MARHFDPTDLEAGRKAALQCIARRDYCSNELRSKLTQYGFEADLVATIISSLEQEGILDAERYIENFMSYQVARGNGPIRISNKLKSLGFSAEMIKPLVEEGRDWVAEAREVRRRKFGSVPATVHAERLKQARFLLHRGFTGAQISQALGANADIDLETPPLR